LEGRSSGQANTRIAESRNGKEGKVSKKNVRVVKFWGRGDHELQKAFVAAGRKTIFIKRKPRIPKRGRNGVEGESGLRKQRNFLKQNS